MGLLARLKVWTVEILTDTDLNAEFDNILDNGLTNTKITGSSASVSAMQTVVDPGEVGSESLASDNDGEIKRLRNMIKEIVGEVQWYVSPTRDLATGNLAVATAGLSTNLAVTTAISVLKSCNLAVTTARLSKIWHQSSCNYSKIS